MLKLVLTFHHEPDNKDDKKRSVLDAPVEFRNFRLNAVDYSIKPLEKQLTDALSAPLPPGLSTRAVQAAEKERGKLRGDADKWFAILKNRNSGEPANATALGWLYYLRGNAGWLIEQAALRADAPNGVLYGWTGGADKILRDGMFPGTVGGTARVELARNEAEGIQIALWPLKIYAKFRFAFRISARMTEPLSLPTESLPSQSGIYSRPHPPTGVNTSIIFCRIRCLVI